MFKKVLTAAVLMVMVAAASAVAAEPLKIGYLAALTGDYASYGKTEVNMAGMIIDEVNKKGGVLGQQIELVVYDTKSRNEDAVNAVRRMIEKDKVVAIIGANSSGINIATGPIVNRGKTAQIATVATNELVTVDARGKVLPYSFRICFTDPYQGKLAADFAAKDLKKMKGAVLYNVGSDYAQGLREYFKVNYKKLGGMIVADEGYRETDVDFRAQLTKVKSEGADLLFLPGLGKDMALIIKQAAELGMKITIVGGDGYGDFMNEIAGKAMEGTYWINHTYMDDPEMKPVFARYKKVYNDECKEFVNGTMSYDATMWLLDAIRRAGKADSVAIAKALENTKNLKLAHSNLTISPKDHNPVNKAGIILKVDKNLKAGFYKKIEPGK